MAKDQRMKNDEDRTNDYLRFEEFEAVNTDQQIAIGVDFEQVSILCVKPQTSVTHNIHALQCSYSNSSSSSNVLISIIFNCRSKALIWFSSTYLTFNEQLITITGPPAHSVGGPD